MFTHYKQADLKDCGPTCLKIIAKHYGRAISIQVLRELCETTREGSNLLLLSETAEKIGFKTLATRLNVEELYDISLPCIMFWNDCHFVVLYKLKKNNFYISDPAHGLIKYNREDFLKLWIGENVCELNDEGIVLLFETTPKFYSSDLTKFKEKTFSYTIISKYLLRYKKFLIQLIIGLFGGSILQLIFPFLTQSVVDIGIHNQNLNFIYVILIAQLFLFFGRTGLELIRSWIILHLSTRISISLISDFFIKLMNLPISFFDVRMTGDIMQRINDHHRIEKFLTTSSLNILFSFFNLLILSGVLAYYSLQIFFIFLLGSVLYFSWIFFFLEKRKLLDYQRFSQQSEEQSKVIELINGMQEIKLHNAERQKRWSWEYIQVKLFKISIKALVLEQIQSIGSGFINELKNIIIIFLAAKLVIEGNITLGMMVAMTSIVGILNGPVLQLINFIKEAQDAKISMSRLSEIHEKEDEVQRDIEKINEFPQDSDIILKKISFRYPGTDTKIFRDLTLTIPSNKVTAIVGTSGSGKTTLMKILLKFYEPQKGEIKIKKPNGIEINLGNISQKIWRENIGTVMQEGYIFNDSIENNIAIGVTSIDKKQLDYACEISNIKDFIENMPLGFNTKIGMEGIGLSSGQKQRLLISRAVYKNPQILFFDEATSALDAKNERKIVEKLDTFFKGRTVVVIAHRLSTVINADKIIVLNCGSVIEEGTHEELIKLKGNYFELVKNQLQLDYA